MDSSEIKKSKHTESKHPTSSDSLCVGSRSYVGSPEGFRMEAQGTPRPSRSYDNASKTISLGSRSYVGSPEGFKMEAQGTPRPSYDGVK